MNTLMWEIAFLVCVLLAFLIFSKEWAMPKKFFQREDTRRIRSYFKKKNLVAELEQELKDYESKLREAEREEAQKKHMDSFKKLK